MLRPSKHLPCVPTNRTEMNLLYTWGKHSRIHCNHFNQRDNLCLGCEQRLVKGKSDRSSIKWNRINLALSDINQKENSSQWKTKLNKKTRTKQEGYAEFEPS